MSKNSLSAELLMQIFKELPNNTLYQCLFVCKTWSEIAVIIRYHQIILSNNHAKFFQHAWTIRSNGTTLSDYVYHLNFSFEHELSRLAGKDDFHKLITGLPRLQTIQFEITSSISTYLSYLLDMPIHQLNKLQQIAIPNANILKDETINKYILNTHRLCNTITKLRFEKLRLSYFKGDCEQVIKFFSEFKNLKELSIWNRDRYGLIGVNMMSILNACQNLTHFVYISTFSDMDLLSNTPKGSENPMKNTKLRVLTLNVLDLTPLNIEYILENIPNRKLTLDLRISSKTLNQWVQSIDSSLLDKFIRYLQNVQHLTLYMSDQINRQSASNHYSNIVELNNTTDISSSWNFIHKLKQNQQVTYHLSIFFTDRNYKVAHQIELDNKQHTLLVSLYLPSERVMWGKHIDISFTKSIHISHTKQGVYEIEYMFNILKSSLLTQQQSCMYFYCNKGTIIFGPYNHHREEPAQFYKRLTSPRNNKLDHRIEYVLFKYFQLSNVFLYSIATAYPDIKNIVFKKCKFTDCQELKQNSCKITLDFHEFKYLDQIALDLENIVQTSSGQDRIYIEIHSKELSTSPRYYTFLLNETENNEPIVYLEEIDSTGSFSKAKYSNCVAIIIQCAQIDEIVLRKKSPNETNYFKIQL